MGESPEAIHVVNQLRLAGEIDRIGDRSARILEQAANRILRDLSVTQGPASRLALQAQLAQIDAIFQAAGADAYQRFVEDVLKKQQAWTGRSEKEVQANLESAVDQGLMAQSTAQAGPAAGQALGSLYRGQQAILSEQALRVASTMPALELAVVGSQKQPYSLQKEFANAFLQPDGKSTAQAFQAQVDRLQETFERSVRQAVVTGQTTQALVRDLKGDGQAITGSMRAPIEQIRSVARTGAQSVANAIQDSQLQENPAVEFVEFVATLDSRTSPVCRATDGNVYKKGSHPVPPLHFRCRSTITAFIPGREEGSRSMTMLVEDENGRVKSYGAYSPAIKGRLSERQEALLRKNQSGKPPSYEEWLRAQPAAAQDGILGRRNGAKFRANDGRLTTTTTPGVKRQLGAMPKPLTAAQIKPKKKPKLSTADLASPLRQDPPKTPPAPAGSGGGAVVATPKTPKKPIPAKPKTKPAPKPKSSQTTTAASAKPAVPAKAAAGVKTPKTPAKTTTTAAKLDVAAIEKQITGKQQTLAFLKKQQAKASSPVAVKTQQQGIDKIQKEIDGLKAKLPAGSPLKATAMTPLQANQAIKAHSKTLLVAKPGSPEFVSALEGVKEAKAVLAQLPSLTQAKPAIPATPKITKNPNLKKRQKGAKPSGVKSENKKITASGDLSTVDVYNEPEPSELGWNGDQMVAFQNDFGYWSDTGYSRIRGAQLIKNKAKPRKGTPDWKAMDDVKFGYSESEQREFLQSADNLEDFISRAPKYNGQVHRGILLPDDAAYDSFMKDLAGSKRVSTLESWSENTGTAYDFATGKNQAGGGSDRGIEIVMHVENRHGAPVAGYSTMGTEEEVLMPSRVRYKVLKKEVYTEDNSDLDFNSKGGKRKRVEIYVEQIEN